MIIASNENKKMFAQYVIKFTNGNKVRYLIPMKGILDYSILDSGRLENAKTWKTKKGADKYLENILKGYRGDELCSRWETITVAKVMRYK